LNERANRKATVLPPTPALRDPKRLTCRLRLFIPNNDPLLAKWGPWFKRYDPDLYERVLGDWGKLAAALNKPCRKTATILLPN
jgi:hypothetical protein